jgi:mediator of RNA polymerase II transcription subunit 31
MSISMEYVEVTSSTAKNDTHITTADTDEEHIKPDEDDENEATRRRFQIELEFVQSLANPNYLNFLAQRGYFKKQTFLNYLKYLMYWKEPEYCKHLVYPQCLRLLEMLQHEQFLKQIVNAQCSKFVDEQLLLVWLHYKKKHDWIRCDPSKMPENIETSLYKIKTRVNQDGEERMEVDVIGENGEVVVAAAAGQDPFSALTYIKNEKF